MSEMNPVRPHPSEGELVRFMDQELSDLERSRVRKHVQACSRCADRVATLEELSARASRELAQSAAVEVDPLARARALAAARAAARTPRSRPWWRAGQIAASLALLAVGAMAAEPIRNWVAARWGDEPAPARVVRDAPPPAAPGGGPLVLFEPTGEVFRVVVEHQQAAGALHLEVRDVPRASARVTDSGRESILVLPSGLRVENNPASGASYTVTLPASLDRVEVVVGGSTLATVVPDRRALPWTRSIPLARQTGPR